MYACMMLPAYSSAACMHGIVCRRQVERPAALTAPICHPGGECLHRRFGGRVSPSQVEGDDCVVQILALFNCKGSKCM